MIPLGGKFRSVSQDEAFENLLTFWYLEQIFIPIEGVHMFRDCSEHLLDRLILQVEEQRLLLLCEGNLSLAKQSVRLKSQKSCGEPAFSHLKQNVDWKVYFTYHNPEYPYLVLIFWKASVVPLL